MTAECNTGEIRYILVVDGIQAELVSDDDQQLNSYLFGNFMDVTGSNNLLIYPCHHGDLSTCCKKPESFTINHPVANILK